MSPNTTSDELQERIAELERKVGHSGSLWDVATAFIPVWLVAAAIAGFAGFTGWEYYQKSQQELAKTQRLQFEAQIAEVEARANTSGEALKLKAELGAKQEEARQARVDADAKKQEADGATLNEKKVAAELRAKQADADKAQAEAAAMIARFDGDKLENRLQRAQQILAEMEAAANRGRAAANSLRQPFRAYALAACQNNRYARLINCPEQFWPREAAKPAPQTDRAAPAQAASAAAPAPQERFATVNTTRLNLRSCPAANCEKIVEMPEGTRAKVIGDAGNGWAQLEVTYQNGRKAKGFANAKHLQF